MRKIVPECRALDSTPIEEIAIDPRMRDDMSAVLKGLQCVYCKAQSRAALFTILEAHFQPGTRRDVGRPGMDLWRVIVFAIVKQCLDLDYDALLYRANNDLLLRELLGHGEAAFDAVKYSRQRLVDNVQLLTPELVLIHLIVRTGHKVAGKKSGAALGGRCDSRVVKTHVHYPTDVGLCWDAVRGLIRVSARSAAAFALPGWRKHADRTRKVYQAFSRVRTAPRYRQNPKGVKAYLRPVHTDCSTCPYAVECLGHSGEIGGGASGYRVLLALCGLVGGSGVASSWARRFHMRRKCFPSTSHIRVGSAKARRGCWRSWAFRSHW